MKSITAKICCCIVTMITLAFSFDPVWAQGSHITCSLENCSSVSANSLEFDFYIVNNGSTSMKLNSIAFGININGSILTDVNDQLLLEYSGFSELPSSIVGTFSFGYSSTLRQLKFTSLPSAVDQSTAPDLPANVKVKVGHFIASELNHNWVAGSTTGFVLNTTVGFGNTNTGAVIYINGASVGDNFNTGSNRAVDLSCSITLNCNLSTYYADVDADGYGNLNASQQACTIPAGYVSSSTDCNDGNAAIHPGASDICNGTDDDCNGIVDDHSITAVVTPSGTVGVCDGSSIILTANNGTGITYQWIKGSKNISGETNQTYSTKKAAGYKVKESNSFGCSSTSAVVTVVVNSSPTATVTAQSSLDLCVQTPVTLQANAGTGFIYQWKKGSTNLANATNQTYAATATGSYKVVVTNSSGCTKISVAVSILKNNPAATITPLSSLDLCGHTSVTLQANAGTGYTYQWKKGNSDLAGATNQIYAASVAGKYKVIVTGSAGCSATSTVVTVIKSCKKSSADNPQCCTQLDIYPNPNDGLFVIDLQTEGDETTGVIDVFNAIGQQVYEQVIIINEGLVHHEVQLQKSLPDGIYFVKVIANGEVYLGQIIYQKNIW